MKKGDVIKCNNPDELIEMDYAMMAQGYVTDYLYEHNGEKGYYLEILKEPRL